MRISKDAVAQWEKMLDRAFVETGARMIVVPVRMYGAGDDYTTEGVLLAPLVVERDAVKGIGDRLAVAFDAHHSKFPVHGDEDVALSRDVLVINGRVGVNLKRFDIWDGQPGRALHPGDKFVKHYAHLRTGNGHHLYPRRDVFLASGGGEIADPNWSLGFLRVTESAAKGAIEAVS